MNDTLVTVDTGAHTDAFRGALVTWLHAPRGGYGYAMPIDAEVLQCLRGGRLRIIVTKKDGSRVRRTVLAANCRWRALR